LFKVDYLRNVTPDGELPVHPVRCFRVARRIIGKGYWEKFEDAHNGVDEFYNQEVVRDRHSDPLGGARLDLLKNGSNGEDVLNYPGKIHALKENVEDISKVFTKVELRNGNGGFSQRLQQMLQMQQINLGTATAAQSEIAGVPSNDTATGSKLIAGHGDIVTGCQIDQRSEE